MSNVQTTGVIVVLSMLGIALIWCLLALLIAASDGNRYAKSIVVFLVAAGFAFALLAALGVFG